MVAKRGTPARATHTGTGCVKALVLTVFVLWVIAAHTGPPGSANNPDTPSWYPGQSSPYKTSPNGGNINP